jgi:hypothetical protein
MTNQPPDDEGNAPEQITETENTENKETEAERVPSVTRREIFA